VQSHNESFGSTEKRHDFPNMMLEGGYMKKQRAQEPANGKRKGGMGGGKGVKASVRRYQHIELG
jgi:hypothetical protein